MSKILVFSPHFDDESIACGGTIAKHRGNGDEVSIVFMTAGNCGNYSHPGISPTEYSQIRKGEAAEALKVLGVSKPFECLELDEGFMRFTTELEKQLIRLIRSIKPDIIYMPHDQDNHNDHIVTNKAVVQAAYRSGWGSFPYLGTPPHKVNELRAYEVWTPLRRPNLYSNITDVLALKQEAIKRYKSQLIDTKYDEASLGLNRYRGIMSLGMEYAEAFNVEKIDAIAE
jgi:LmbE family N-acetylglucosaminyl deacetylase